MLRFLQGVSGWVWMGVFGGYKRLTVTCDSDSKEQAEMRISKVVKRREISLKAL
jgi:hypothetical protein